MRDEGADEEARRKLFMFCSEDEKDGGTKRATRPFSKGATSVRQELSAAVDGPSPGVETMVTGRDARAARALLGWTQANLADRANVGVRTVKRFENGEATLPVVADAIERVLGEVGLKVFHDAGELAKLEGAIGVAIVMTPT